MFDVTTIGEPKDLARLYAKIAAVQGAVGHVPKTGHNKFHNYDYVTEGDLLNAVRRHMSEQKLALIPAVRETERIDMGQSKSGPLTRVHMTFTLACGDTGASITAGFVGDGQDAGDKGVYKAYTGALKYFLMKCFLVATGDDPEQDEVPRQQERQAPPPHQQTINQARKPVITTEEAEQRFWTKYAPVLGDKNWTAVQRLFGVDIPPPATAQEWISCARYVDSALQEETQKAGA
jgi:hypothetical protein